MSTPETSQLGGSEYFTVFDNTKNSKDDSRNAGKLNGFEINDIGDQIENLENTLMSDEDKCSTIRNLVGALIVVAVSVVAAVTTASLGWMIFAIVVASIAGFTASYMAYELIQDSLIQAKIDALRIERLPHPPSYPESPQ